MTGNAKPARPRGVTERTPKRVRHVAHSLLVRWRRLVALVARRGRRRSICESVEEWAADNAGAEAKIVFPPRQITRQLPRTIEPEVHREYVERQVANQRGRYLVPIHRARLIGDNGLVVLPDQSYTAESVYGRPLLEQDPDFVAPRQRRVVAKPGVYFSLIVRWSASGNYYHWFHDTLSRLFGVLEHLPADTQFIVPADLRPFQWESLRLAGINDDQVVHFTGDEVWELETLFFAPPTTNSGSDRRDVDLWLRDNIVNGYEITPAAPHRRIFISRRHAPRRRLANEDAVEEFLRGFGFETYVAESQSLREQAAAFAEVEIVVAPHGAGFTNMLFAPAGLKVLDMIEPGRISHGYVYWTMAEELGHEYWYFVADSVVRPGHQNDIFVPIDKLAATFERMQLDRMPPALLDRREE